LHTVPKIPLSDKYQPYVAAAYLATKYPGLTAAAATAYGAYKLYRFNKRYPLAKHSVPVALADSMGPVPKKRREKQLYRPYPAPQMNAKSAAVARTRVVPVAMRRKLRIKSRHRKVYQKRNKGRPYKKYGKYSKKYNRRPSMYRIVRDCYERGATSRLEFGGIRTDNYCVTIGHTLPFRQVRRTFFMSAIKKICDKVGISMENPEAGMPSLTAGDAFYIYYRAGIQSSNGAALNFSYACVGAAESLATVTNGIIAAYETSGIAGQYEDIQLERVFFYANGAGDLTSMQLSLVHCDVEFYFNSTLKLQNRTSDSATNTQADDLVAQHVTGKSYFGYGNYAQSRVRNANAGNVQVDIVGNDYGIIGDNNWSTNASGDQWSEPLPRNHFQNVKSSHGVDFNPGELKKSHLKYHCVMKINEFLKFMVRTWGRAGVGVENQVAFMIKKGKFRFFMLEKEIETIALGVTPNTTVTIGYEYDHTVGCVIKPKQQTFLTRENLIEVSIPSK